MKRRSGVVSVSLSAPSSGLLEAELELHALEQRPGAARVAGGAAADGHGVRPLRLEVEERVERRHAVDLRLGSARARRDVLEHLHRQVLVAVLLLQLLEDAEQRAGSAGLLADDPVDQVPVLRHASAPSPVRSSSNPPNGGRAPEAGPVTRPAGARRSTAAYGLVRTIQ